MRTEYCGKLRQSHIGQQVTLCGWVHHLRNLGKMVFIEMRDCEGTVQVFFDQNHSETLQVATELRHEFCIQVTGIVRMRNKKNINIKMETGSIEILANKLTIINRSEPLPLDFNKINTDETRLKYRYLELRRPEMINRLKIRANITKFIRYFMDRNSFIDIETPMLTKATPEGARDYIVPSRMHKGKFYALPQSPQLFKQLLMISGFDRYYQIVKCFRDEDLRVDRQPEFTQLDIEAAFMTSEQIRKIMELLIRNLWKKINGKDIGQFSTITYSEAHRRFGSDKPNLHNPLELVDVADLFKQTSLNFFSRVADDPKYRIVALCIPQGSNLISRNQIFNYDLFVKRYGARGLTYVKVNERAKGLGGIDSPIKNGLSSKLIESILSRVNAKDGDLIFFSSDKTKVISDALGALRIKLGKDFKLIDESQWSPLWIIDFPMFEDNKESGLHAVHHPFTSPKNITTIEELKNNPKEIIADAYDLVINGYEIAGGSTRIHNHEMQKTVFTILGMSEQEQKNKFGFLLDALKFGAPPHTGIAFGLDRLTMLLTGTNNIRDIIAFPKTTSATCLTTDAPGPINSTSLAELNITVNQ